MCLQRKRCVKVVSYSPLTYVCLCTQLLESPSWAMAGSHTYKTFPPCCHRDSVTTFKVTVQVCLHKLLRKGKLRYSHQHTTKRAQPLSHCFPSPPTIKGHAQHFTPLLGLVTLQRLRPGHRVTWSLAIWNCERALRTYWGLCSCHSALAASQTEAYICLGFCHWPQTVERQNSKLMLIVCPGVIVKGVMGNSLWTASLTPGVLAPGLSVQLTLPRDWAVTHSAFSQHSAQTPFVLTVSVNIQTKPV